VKSPIYCTIGHSFDKGVSPLEKAYQGSFTTPSMAGIELGKNTKVLSEYYILQRQLKELSTEKFKFLEERIKKLNKELKKALDSLLFYRTLTLVFFVAVVFLLFLIIK
jgi:deoxyribodipyrimidine photolyase